MVKDRPLCPTFTALLRLFGGGRKVVVHGSAATAGNVVPPPPEDHLAIQWGANVAFALSEVRGGEASEIALALPTYDQTWRLGRGPCRNVS